MNQSGLSLYFSARGFTCLFFPANNDSKKIQKKSEDKSDFRNVVAGAGEEQTGFLSIHNLSLEYMFVSLENSSMKRVLKKKKNSFTTAFIRLSLSPS